MRRQAILFLEQWLTEADRKPLVLRGARQVGKTWLVRELARISGKTLIEINFEKMPQVVDKFTSNDPKEILLQLSSLMDNPIEIDSSILFLDEIQAAPTLFAKLRWFAEDLPQLPLIAAGSLLEFLLAEHSFSMPVGRIEYCYIEPLSFEEFLLAHRKQNLYDYLQAFQIDMLIPESLHQQFTTLFKEYLFVGGLPAAVASWRNERDLSKISKIHLNLLATYRDDFAKYHGRLAIARLEEVMEAVPKMLGQKCVYSRINKEVQSAMIKQAIDLLEKGRICHAVKYTAANGVPLGAELNQKHGKEIFLDMGLCNSLLGLNLHTLTEVAEITLINQGGVAEQVVGQGLRTINPFYVEPKLYYWVRDEKGSSAEIDYIIAHGNKIIPIEVKAGATGSLKSLHLFMELKKLSLAVRFNSDLPSKTQVAIKDHREYTLLSLPFYLLGQIYRLL